MPQLLVKRWNNFLIWESVSLMKAKEVLLCLRMQRKTLSAGWRWWRTRCVLNLPSVSVSARSRVLWTHCHSLPRSWSLSGRNGPSESEQTLHTLLKSRQCRMNRDGCEGAAEGNTTHTHTQTNTHSLIHTLTLHTHTQSCVAALHHSAAQSIRNCSVCFCKDRRLNVSSEIRLFSPYAKMKINHRLSGNLTKPFKMSGSYFRPKSKD